MMLKDSHISWAVALNWMDDIRNDFFWRFDDVTKQNDHDSVGTLYKEVLGELVIRYRSYFSRKVLISIDIPTNISRGFEVYFLKFHHNQVEVNIKNQLPYNFSLFTTLCPSKIWQLNLKKSPSSSFLYRGL